jgi:hypothetical protein
LLPVPSSLANSTCNPPCEQWLARLGAGAQSFWLLGRTCPLQPCGTVAVHRPCLLGPPWSLSGAGASASVVCHHCGGVHVCCHVVLALVLVLAWFVVIARWGGCRCWCGVSHCCLLAFAIHPASSCSQGWWRVLGRLSGVGVVVMLELFASSLVFCCSSSPVPHPVVCCSLSPLSISCRSLPCHPPHE